jgi:hypothetical protein
MGGTLCDKVCQRLATGRWFSPGTPVSSTNKTDRYDIAEILFKEKELMGVLFFSENKNSVEKIKFLAPLKKTAHLPLKGVFFCNLFIFLRTNSYIHDSIYTMFQYTKVTM